MEGLSVLSQLVLSQLKKQDHPLRAHEDDEGTRDLRREKVGNRHSGERNELGDSAARGLEGSFTRILKSRIITGVV